MGLSGCKTYPKISSPVVSISGPTSGITNANYTYHISLSGGTSPYTFNWSNGEELNGSGNPFTSTSGTFTVSWLSTGTYNVSVTVTDSSGRTGSVSLAVNISSPLVNAEDYLTAEKITNNNSPFPINEPKIVFSSNGAIYIGDLNGEVIEKLASAPEKVYQITLSDVSSDKKWIIVTVDNKLLSTSKNMLYAINIETLKLVKIAEDYWETSFTFHFIDNSHRLVYAVRGVNAPYSYVAIFDLDEETNIYLLKPTTEDKDFAFYKLGMYQEAIESYEKAFGKNPNSVHTLDFLVILLNKLGRYEEALETCEKALKIDPRNSSILKKKLSLERKLQNL